MKKSKKQLVLEELKQFTKNSFINFEFLISPNEFALSFLEIRKQSKHLAFFSDENIIFSEILENLEEDFLKNIVYFQIMVKRMNYVFYKIKDTMYLFRNDFISSNIIEKSKNIYYGYNEDVKKFDDVFKAYLSLYALSKENEELLEYRDEKGKQIEEMYSIDNMLIHKSVALYEKTEKIIADKVWNGTLNWNWRDKWLEKIGQHKK